MQGISPDAFPKLSMIVVAAMSLKYKVAPNGPALSFRFVIIRASLSYIENG